MINCILFRMQPYILAPNIQWIDVLLWEKYMQVIIRSWKHCQQTKGLQYTGGVSCQAMFI